jgi:hypothetical protein
VLRTPAWWFKRKKDPAAPAPAALPTTALSSDVQSTAPAPTMPGVDLKLDPQRQRISFHITYTGAIVTTVALVVVVGLAYLIGTRMRAGPAQASAQTPTDQLRQGAPRGGVLNVRPNPPRSAQPPEPDDATTAVPPPAPRPASTTQPTQRVIGLNYVVMQGYPPEEKAMAVEARDLLIKNGVACTIEQDLPGLNRNWHIVVGLQGFDRIGYNPDYERYERLIRDVNARFPRNAKFKKLEPMPYKWKG